MEYSTRISDLPENITLGHNGGFSQGQSQTFAQGQSQTFAQGISQNDRSQTFAQGQSQTFAQGQSQTFAIDNGLDIPSLPTTYTQMNVHPNPYGQGPPPQGGVPNPIPPPQQTYVHKASMQSPGQNSYLGNPENPSRQMPQHPLPIRDVPRDTTGYQQDDAIKPNYIPKKQDIDETYVYEQEDRIRRQKRAKKQKMFSDWKFDDLIAELQQPIIVAVLFLVFQSPTLHIIMAKYLAFLPLFGETGDLTITGSLFKSAVFGGAYFGLVRFMAYIDQ